MRQLDKQSRFFCFLGHGVNDLFLFILPLVLPLILRSFRLNYGKAGGIITLYLSVIALCSFILGKISNRLSRRNLLSIGFIIAATGLILSGFMPTLPLFLMTLAVTAFGVSVFHPIMYSIIDENTTANRGLMFGTFEFWGTLTIFGMLIINGFLLSRISWKTILVLTALPGYFAGILYKTKKNLPLFARKEPEKEKIFGSSEIIIPSRIFILFILSSFLRMLSITAILNFLPTFLVMEKGISSSISAYATAFYCIGGMLFSLAAGKAGDKWGAFPVLITAICLIPFTIFLLVHNSVFWMYPVIIFLLGSFSCACNPVQNMLLTRLTLKKGSGEAFGFMTAGMTLANAFGPVTLGYLADSIGLSSAMQFFMIPVIIGMLLLIGIARSPHVKSLYVPEMSKRSSSKILRP